MGQSDLEFNNRGSVKTTSCLLYADRMPQNVKGRLLLRILAWWGLGFHRSAGGLPVKKVWCCSSVVIGSFIVLRANSLLDDTKKP
jgi:hypothetical protein